MHDIPLEDVQSEHPGGHNKHCYVALALVGVYK